LTALFPVIWYCLQPFLFLWLEARILSALFSVVRFLIAWNLIFFGGSRCLFYFMLIIFVCNAKQSLFLSSPLWLSFFQKANYKISFLHSSLFSLLLKIAFGVGNPIGAISRRVRGGQTRWEFNNNKQIAGLLPHKCSLKLRDSIQPTSFQFATLADFYFIYNC